MFCLVKMVLSKKKINKKKSVFCENMKCKFSLLRDLAILYYRTKG